MKNFALALPLIALLAACGGEPAPAPEPTETAAAAAAPVSTLPAPDQEVFSEVFAATCADAEPVSNAVCRRAMGADSVSCEYGLGEDQYLRHKATLVANADATGWTIDNAAALCAEHGTHHVDN